MTISTDMQWLAIQAHPTAEAVAEFNLSLLSIETLLPVVHRAIRHATRRPRLIARALFPGYLFARFCAADSLRAVTYSRGVVRVVGAGDRPIPVQDAIIASIRARIGADGFVELAEHRLVAGDEVRIASGPLAGWSGVFERELGDTQRVEILIQALEQSRVVREKVSVMIYCDPEKVRLELQPLEMFLAAIRVVAPQPERFRVGFCSVDCGWNRLQSWVIVFQWRRTVLAIFAGWKTNTASGSKLISTPSGRSGPARAAGRACFDGSEFVCWNRSSLLDVPPVLPVPERQDCGRVGPGSIPIPSSSEPLLIV
ncbi:MAG TPA: transcription termination/antitermination NusG family protein [Terrimicrobiaceae bacterium]